jgi:hypothetical protein
MLCIVEVAPGGNGSPAFARFVEESIPAADLSPTATPSPPPGAQGMMPTATATPGAGQIFREPTPLPTSGEGPPPPEVGASSLSLRVSDSSLQNWIDQEPNPARQASMRIVEQARSELVDGHPDEATRGLSRALEIDPSDPYAYFYLARVYIVRRNYQQAMTFLKRAEIGFGSRSGVWLSETLAFEGMTYEESGHQAAATAAYQQALQVNPGNLMARVGYTRLAPTVMPPSPEGAPSGNAIMPPPSVSAPPPPPASSPPRPSYE